MLIGDKLGAFPSQEKLLLRKRRLLGLKLSLVILSGLVVQLTSSLTANAATINSLRYLLGEPVVAHHHTAEERAEIIARYQAIVTHNLEVASFQASNPHAFNLKVRAEEKQNHQALTASERNLVKLFESDAPVNKVLQAESTVQNVLFTAEQIPQLRSKLSMRYESNPYKAEYQRILKVDSLLRSYVPLGVVGNLLPSPVENHFILIQPYGSITNMKSKKTVYNDGLSLKGYVKSPVLSVWHGEIDQISWTRENGYKVEVSDGNGLLTRYSHLGYVDVKLGEKVAQGDVLGGWSMKTSNPYLHFSVILNGQYLNPIYFFGSKGKQALENFISLSTNPSVLRMASILPHIKSGVSPLPSTSGFLSGSRPVNFTKPDTSPSGSVSLQLKRGYTMPDPTSQYLP